MITFSNIRNLADQLSNLIVNNTKEYKSAVNCLRIEQVSNKITKFTTYEPKVGLYERNILELDPNCFGTVGDIYLVDAKEFINVINTLAKTNCLYLTITVEEGMLVYYDDYKYDYNGELTYSAKDYLKLYPGDDIDFNPPVLTNLTKIGYSSSESFNNLVKVITETGQFSEATESYTATVNGCGRTILLNTFIDKIELFNLSKNKSTWFTFTQPASFDVDNNYILEGRHFNRLKLYVFDNEPVEFYTCIYTEYTPDTTDIEYTAEWFYIVSKYNSVGFRVMCFEEVIKVYYDQFKQLLDLDVINRELNQYSLNNAFTRLKNKYSKTQLNILLVEDIDESEPRFILKDADAILASTEYRVPIYYTDSNDFRPICLTVDELDAVFNILRIYNDALKTQIPTINLGLAVYIRKQGDQTITFYTMLINPINTDDIKILIQPKDGLAFLEKVDVNTYESLAE